MTWIRTCWKSAEFLLEIFKVLEVHIYETANPLPRPSKDSFPSLSQSFRSPSAVFPNPVSILSQSLNNPVTIFPKPVFNLSKYSFQFFTGTLSHFVKICLKTLTYFVKDRKRFLFRNIFLDLVGGDVIAKPLKTLLKIFYLIFSNTCKIF